jgi:hypothetical protein
MRQPADGDLDRHAPIMRARGRIGKSLIGSAANAMPRPGVMYGRPPFGKKQLQEWRLGSGAIMYPA